MTAMSEREFEAFQAFVFGCKVHWTTELFGELKKTYEEKLAGSDTKAEPPSPGRVAALLEGDVTNSYFGWFERHLQRMKYSGRYGLVPFFDSRRAEVAADAARPLPDSLLALDEDFTMPAYYEEVDVHQHPGGVWSDEIAGRVYEKAARSTTPLLTQDKDLHYRFVDEIYGRKKGRRVLDMACGFGKTTRPLFEANRAGEVVGIDLSAPCLKVAAASAAETQTRNVRYAQQDASRTTFGDSSFDVVTSTMMLHEMPPEVVRDVLTESYRLLEPGGLMIHLDFLPPDDEFLAYLHFGHSKRNNEPWMATLASMNIAKAMTDTGFSKLEILPFEESPGAKAEAGTKWRFPWTIIAGTKA